MIAWIKRFYAALHSEHGRRATIADLSALNDRTLRDIGLHRAQIPLLAEKMSRRAQDCDPGLFSVVAIPAEDTDATWLTECAEYEQAA